VGEKGKRSNLTQAKRGRNFDRKVEGEKSPFGGTKVSPVNLHPRQPVFPEKVYSEGGLKG